MRWRPTSWPADRRWSTGCARDRPGRDSTRRTLQSCFGHGAAIVAHVATNSGKRPDWRNPKDLEKAQIAAFRHQAFDYWKKANTESRRGDRHAVTFDPDQHAPLDEPMQRLFDQPDLEAIREDLLTELDDVALRDFWRAVLREGVTFKESGDRLGLTKAQVMARTLCGPRAVRGLPLRPRVRRAVPRARARPGSGARGGRRFAGGGTRREAHLGLLLRLRARPPAGSGGLRARHPRDWPRRRPRSAC